MAALLGTKPLITEDIYLKARRLLNITNEQGIPHFKGFPGKVVKAEKPEHLQAAS